MKSNSFAIKYFDFATVRDYVHKLARRYWKYYGDLLYEYASCVSAGDAEDLEQELWTRALESRFSGSVAKFVNFMDYTAKRIYSVARERQRMAGQVYGKITAISQLPYKERREAMNKMYGGGEDRYDEESMP